MNASAPLRHTWRLPARKLTAAAAGALVLLTSCGVSGLSFQQDKRVDIIRPKDRAEVRLPVRVAWTVKDFAIGGGRGSFGVLVDREPPRPGKKLDWLFRGNDSCKGPEGKALCATSEFLEQRNVFRTTSTSFTVQQVNKLTGNEKRRQFHELTVVLLDETGRRVGEGAWSVQFDVKGRR